MSERPVRVRIGPSPTGEPHVGTAYIALYNLAFARKHGGKFVLRVEDTDQERSKPEWERQIMEALKWLGLMWDEGPDVGGPYGPYRQSERKDIYTEHAQRLLDAGHAYRCFATKAELDEARQRIQAENGDRSAASRLHRDLPDGEVKRRLDAGEPYVVRMKAPLEGTIVVPDRLRGDVAIEATQVDDQILLKSDGFPTYHLANVVDDHLMGITHVMRAEEWISSTPKHVLLYEMFGWEAPQFIHMPLLRNKDKSKISKRKNPVSILDYQQRGFIPEAVVNYLGMLGFTMPDERDVFTFDEFEEALDLDRVQLGGPVFDLDKLTWLNGKYLREKMGEADLVRHLRDAVFPDDYLSRIAPLFRERVDLAEQFLDQAGYFFVGDIPVDVDQMLPKKRSAADLHSALEAFAQRVDAQVDFSPEALEAMARAFATEADWKIKDLFMAIRVALTGRTATPPLFDVMSVLGRALVRRRLRNAVNATKKAAAEAKKAADKAAKPDAKPAKKGEKPAKKDKKPAGHDLVAIPGLGAPQADKLAGAGLATTEDLLTRAAAPKDRLALAEQTGLEEQDLLRWTHLADLMRIKGLAGEYAELLEGAGVQSLAALAEQNAEALGEALAKVHAERKLDKKPPHPKGIQMWIERAKALDPRVLV